MDNIYDPLNDSPEAKRQQDKYLADVLVRLGEEIAVLEASPEWWAAMAEAQEALRLDIGGAHQPPASPLRSAPSPLPAPAPHAHVGPTQKISIRIPLGVLAACKREAARSGRRYQTVIVQALQLASARW